MSRQASIGTMIAATALIAWPVLAQTTSRTRRAGAAPWHDIQPPGGHPSATGPAADVRCASKYVTADRHVRASKVVGASVYNDQDQSIGSIDDVLMGVGDRKGATVVLSVGGFLGMGSKLVSVPFDELKIQNDRIVMPGATKASLEGMPEYRYTNA